MKIDPMSTPLIRGVEQTKGVTNKFFTKDGEHNIQKGGLKNNPTQEQTASIVFALLNMSTKYQ